MWRFLRNRRLLLCLHTIFRALILGASRGRLSDSVASCYNVALWNNFTADAHEKFRSAYVKCIKVFFRYTKSYSVTAMLTELNLFKFDSLVDKWRSDFQSQIHACVNGIVQHYVCLHLMWLMLLLFCFYFFIVFCVAVFMGSRLKQRLIDWLIDWLINDCPLVCLS